VKDKSSFVCGWTIALKAWSFLKNILVLIRILWTCSVHELRGLRLMFSAYIKLLLWGRTISGRKKACHRW